MAFFVKVVDSHRQIQVINTGQIVRVFQKPPNWNVILTAGDPVEVSASEAEKLFKTVPVVHPPKEATAKLTG